MNEYDRGNSGGKGGGAKRRYDDDRDGDVLAGQGIVIVNSINIVTVLQVVAEL